MNDELRDYATDIILDCARDVEYSDIFTMAKENLGREVSEDEARQVSELTSRATITVSWEDK